MHFSSAFLLLAVTSESCRSTKGTHAEGEHGLFRPLLHTNRIDPSRSIRFFLAFEKAHTRGKRGKFFITFTQRVRVFSRTREYKAQKEREKEAHATLCGYPGSGIMDESKRLEEKEVSRNGW